MHATPYQELNQVLQELLSRVSGVLGNPLIGIYLQGSFAVGDFDEHSDVDFTAVIDTELTSAEVNELQVMHDQLYGYDSEWAKHLEGSYFPAETLRLTANRGEELWYLDHEARERHGQKTILIPIGST